MALLRRKSSPISEAETALSDLTSRRDVVEQKFDRAHAALAAATNERRQALLDSDLDDATAAARRDDVVRDARDRVEAIGDALQEIERKIADATTKLAELRDRAERAELARAIEADVSVLAEARDAFAAAAERLIRG
jgi:predicted  nucleic acid-binding Zn-ribbon protein